MHGQEAFTLVAGALSARFLPAQGMLCASLLHRGVELLRRVDDLAGDAAAGNAAGIPLLHPWANRLSGWRYTVAGRSVALDPASGLLHRDWNGTVIHGVPWSRLRWTITNVAADSIVAALDWNTPGLLRVFPFAHTLRMDARLDPAGLTFVTSLHAHADGPVPVSFGFHPYLGLPHRSREHWRLRLPAMHRMELDARLIPTGRREPFPAMDRALEAMEFDDGFALGSEVAAFSISDRGLRITVEFLRGYGYAQIYAPRDQDLIALEPMTAPTNALVTGDGLRVVPANGRFEAAFRISVAD